MKRQTVLALLKLVSESLKNIEILQSQVSYQLQELESRENLQNERTLQEIKSQLIERSKLLSNCARHQKRILFQSCGFVKGITLNWLNHIYLSATR